MTFKLKNLVNLSGGAKTNEVPNFFGYWNQDNDTVTGAHFFVYDAMKVGDQVTVVDNDYGNSANYNVSAVSGGKATVVANS
jgi:hypothetical protein